MTYDDARRYDGFYILDWLIFSADTHVPEGYLDLPASNIGVGWVRGNEENGEIFGGHPHEAVCKKLADNGIGSLCNDIGGNGSDTFLSGIIASVLPIRIKTAMLYLIMATISNDL